MNAHSVLENALKDILVVIKPLREDWVMRAKVIEELQVVVQSVESLRGATVEPFGSFVSNLFTRWGDLDISIMLPIGSHISSTGKKRKQNLLQDILRALRQNGGGRRLQFIPNARVPILKFESRHQKISCDISIDNLQGQMKSKFLFWINGIDGRFRDLVLLVKEWAKAHNINNPKTGTLNSYSLSLLVIFHFQTCVPAILPPLKNIYPRNVVDDLTGVRTVAESHIEEICAANIARHKSNKSRAVNRSSLSELFISFLAKFADISSKAGELGICPFTGQWEGIKSNMRWLPKTYALLIEDPFEQPENTARAVSAGNLVKISEAFQTTYHRLIFANRNQTSPLGSLVRPQISHFIAGTPVANPKYTAGHYPISRPQSSAVCSTSRVQHRNNIQLEDRPNDVTMRRKENRPNNFSKKKQEIHSNNLTNQRQESHPSNLTNQRQESHPSNLTVQRSVQQYHSQGQQMWKPKSGRRLNQSSF